MCEYRAVNSVPLATWLNCAIVKVGAAQRTWMPGTSVRARLGAAGFAIGGLAVAGALFLVMHALIRGGRGTENAGPAGQIVNMVRVREDEQLRTKQRVRPRKPPPPKAPPPPPRLRVKAAIQPERRMARLAMPEIAIPVAAGGGPYLGKWVPGDAAAEGEAVPIVRIDPQWPRRALEEGVEGFVRVEVLIGVDGATQDVRVVDSEPGGLFVRNAVRAVRRWKFKPRIVDGVAVERWAVTTIKFQMAR